MSKYEEKIEQLKIEREKESNKYTAEVQQIYYFAMQYCNQFNSQVTIINVERHLMRREITALYKFLKIFGDMGIKLTPFDFVAEDWLFPNAHVDKRKLDNEMVSATLSGVSTTSVLGTFAMKGYITTTTATVGMALPILAPVALPAYWVIKDFKKNANLKDELMKMENKFQEERATWKKALDEMNDEVSFFKTAVQIADIYRGLVATIRDTIADKILPELNGIMAFLYADAIKNCIINNEDPTTAVIGNISEYRGTPYEGHYLFVKNVFEYYTLITTFFTKPVLTNLLEKRNVSEKEFEEFLIEIEKIETHSHELMKNCVIGGELL